MEPPEKRVQTVYKVSKETRVLRDFKVPKEHRVEKEQLERQLKDNKEKLAIEESK